MVGKLQKSSRTGHTHLLVMVDKFTKWIEAMPITRVDATSAMTFFRSFTCRFWAPHDIITNNVSKFTSREFHDFCQELLIQISYASVAHPQTNGLVEKANGMVCNYLTKQNLRPLARESNRAWVEELPSVLCSLRMTPNRSTLHTVLHGVQHIRFAAIRCPLQRATSRRLQRTRLISRT
jgi:transposase InsO family protein